MTSRVGKDVILYSAGEFLFKLAPLASLPFIVRSLGKNEFGAVDLILSIINTLVIFLCFGVGSAIHRYYNFPGISNTERAEIVATGFSFSLVLTCIFFCFYFYFYDQLIDHLSLQYLPDLRYILAAFLFLSIFGQLILDVIRIQGSVGNYLLTAGIARIGSSLLSLVFVINLGMGLQGYFAAPTLAMLFAVFVSIYLIRKAFILKFKLSTLIKIVRYAWPFALLAPLQWLISGLDRYLIADYSGLEALGDYAIAAKVAAIVGLAFASILAAWSPSAIRQQGASAERFLSLHCMIFYGCISIFFATCFFLYWFADWAIVLLFSKTYSDSGQYILLLVIGGSLPMVSATLYSYISLSGKTYLYLLINVLGGVVALITNMVLIGAIGTIGAAVSSAIVGLTLFILNYVIANRLGFRVPTLYSSLVFFLGLSSVFFLCFSPKNNAIALTAILFSFLFFLKLFISAMGTVRRNADEG